MISYREELSEFSCPLCQESGGLVMFNLLLAYNFFLKFFAKHTSFFAKYRKLVIDYKHDIIIGYHDNFRSIVDVIVKRVK